MEHFFLAFDLGASNGRAILGTLSDNKLTMEEVHRFPNKMFHLHGHFYWNIYNIFEELKTGLAKCINDHKVQPESIGIDTWGVDYVLTTCEGAILGLPYAYRDSRTDHTMDEFFKIMDKEQTYMLSGLQFMQFNTLFQLFASVEEKYPFFDIAESMLFMPDALNFMFTGIKKNEYTIASTSALLKPGKAEWEYKLFDAAGIDRKLVEQIVAPGTILGTLLPEVCEETGSKPVPCVAVASHDTAAAIVAVPAKKGHWAYISSGTWSLMGIENEEPLVTAKTLELSFTNEGGVDGTTRFLKNIMGLWLIQECKRKWDAERDFSWNEIVEMCHETEAFSFLIDPDFQGFLNPPDMPEAIRDYCRHVSQLAPCTKSQIARCIYDSLALKYRYTLEQIEEAAGYKIEKIHIIGGGVKNEFLCQLTADVTGLPVFAGPIEGAAIGNILLQARALKHVHSLDEIREIIAGSFEVKAYAPQKCNEDLDAVYQRFKEIIGK
ncbi:MAG: rhamnulokinase [Prolixibacteraceae bacterium]|nr:rhamnulokinase [Prolixibacteraceae bacterium]